MIQVSVQQTKQKEFTKAVNALKKYIYAEVPLKSDKKLSELLETVLNMMFYEDRLSVKKHYYREWYAFVAWLLLEVNIPPRLLLDYLKLMQNIIRNKYKRYTVNINYYFDPEVFKKSFTHKKLFQKRLKHIFLKQLVQVLNKNAKRAIQVEQILDKPSPQQQVEKIVVAQKVVVPSAPKKSQQQSKPLMKPKALMAQQLVVPSAPQKSQQQFKTVVAQQQKPKQKPVIVSVKASSSQQKPLLVKPKALLGDIKKGLKLKKTSSQQQQQKQQVVVTKTSSQQQQQQKPKVVVDQSKTMVSSQQQQKPLVMKPKGLLGDIRKGLVLKKKSQQQKPVKKQQSFLDAIKKGKPLKKIDTKQLQKKKQQQQQEPSSPIAKALKQRRKYVAPVQQQQDDDDEFL